MTRRVSVVRSGERVAAPNMPTGVRGEMAFADQGLWAGVAHIAAGTATGWHHHGDYETCVYVVSGANRWEFGPDGGDTVEAGRGDFVYVPPRLVHRDVSLGPDDVEAIVFRAGQGPQTVSVEGPELTSSS